MTENVESGQGIVQENSENSENIQQNPEINTEIPDNDSSESESGDVAPEKSESHPEESDELPLPEPDISEDEGKKKKSIPEWMKKKIEREKAAAERKEMEAEQLRQENMALRGAVPQNPQAQAPQHQQPAFDPYMPQREQFQSEGEYFMALSDYRDQRRHEAVVMQERQQRAKQHEVAFQTNLKEAIEVGKEKYKDFEERTDYILYGDGFPSNRAMAEAIVVSEYKDDILYFLGTHVKEAERIANSNGVIAAKEIAKIEMRFASRKKSNITKAPAPLNPVTGGKGSALHGNPEKMGMDEFREWYKNKYG